MTQVDAASQTSLTALPNICVLRASAQGLPHRQAWVQQAVALGHRAHVLSLQGCSTKAQVHQALAKALGFPKHVGKNLDALYDTLCDTEPVIAPEGLCLILETAGSSGEIDSEWLDDLFGVFEDAASDRADSTESDAPFRVFFAD